MKGEKMNKFLFFLSIFTIGIFANDVRSDDSLEIAWETEKVFELPESVVYDPTNDVLYVSYEIIVSYHCIRICILSAHSKSFASIYIRV